MTRLITAPLSSKAQLTLPKRVRELLGVREKGDRIGFLLDEESRRIIIIKAEMVPVEEPYTARELRKLLKLRNEPGSKTFASADAFLKHLRSL